MASEYGYINVAFSTEEKERIREKCGLVPVRRQLRQVILDWLGEDEILNANNRNQDNRRRVMTERRDRKIK